MEGGRRKEERKSSINVESLLIAGLLLLLPLSSRGDEDKRGRACYPQRQNLA